MTGVDEIKVLTTWTMAAIAAMSLSRAEVVA
jgi:hypothetical protein